MLKINQVLKCIYFMRQSPSIRPMKPQNMKSSWKGQKIDNPSNPHGGRVGALVGCFVGAVVGILVGILVGFFVGILVGFIGALVGGEVTGGGSGVLVGGGGNWGGSRPIRAKMSARSAMGGGKYPNCVT